MPFPSPKTEDPRQRFEDSRVAAKAALEEIIASANKAGWGTQEIAVALVSAALSLQEAAAVNLDPVESPPVPDAVREQIGQGEQFD